MVRPRTLTLMEKHSYSPSGLHLFADYHTHTRFSHGSGSVLDNVFAASEAGLREVAITDHGPANLFGVGVRNLASFAYIRADVEAVRRIFPDIRVLVGVEANVIGLDGTLDVPDEVLKSLDIVLVGLHPMVRAKSWRDAGGLVGLNLLAKTSLRLARRARSLNTEALVAAVEKHDVDIVTHPGLHLPVDTQELARACARRGTALEINVGHGNVTVDFIRVAAREGAVFCINSDAHRPADVGRLEVGVKTALEAGLEPSRIINADAPEPTKRHEGQPWIRGIVRRLGR